eukprot:TRINITY_DN6702_c0_g2_i3.p2 TRINITY_DN6702_c0_g2~~TRINITY_DN6702_c0_g2_i3.p2  ORF type:complete len:175 (+),score=24.88 TRINITY_DN6702_c0_g2_i3:41-565(+)
MAESIMAGSRVKIQCPTCGYKSFPQWMNDQAHCLKCDAVVRTRPSCHQTVAESVQGARRAPGEVSTYKQPPGSAMESASGCCQQEHWKSRIFWSEARARKRRLTECIIGNMASAAIARLQRGKLRRPRGQCLIQVHPKVAEQVASACSSLQGAQNAVELRGCSRSRREKVQLQH